MRNIALGNETCANGVVNKDKLRVQRSAKYHGYRVAHWPTNERTWGMGKARGEGRGASEGEGEIGSGRPFFPGLFGLGSGGHSSGLRAHVPYTFHSR